MDDKVIYSTKKNNGYAPKIKKKSERDNIGLNQRDILNGSVSLEKSVENKRELDPLISVYTQPSNSELVASSSSSMSKNATCNYEIVDLDSTVSESETNISSAVESEDCPIENSSENLLFRKYFRVVEKKNDVKRNVTAICIMCGRNNAVSAHVRGSLNATSNFVRHLRVMLN